VLDHPALLANTDTGVLVEEVQRHPRGELVGPVDAQKIRMQDHRPRRMALQVLENHVLRLAIHLQRNDVGIKRLVFQRMRQLVVHEGNRLGIGVTAIDDGGYFCRESTQAAARTFPHVDSRTGIENEVGHCLGSC
jgi:hypothetical protein